ncbi:uncharacterized protein V1510DRAFT_417395 [Dipodascopsis tothii]|uniref:uncharacterized protein n=1 Tax=Dipodascopsis tothii TaxID=44089 RepID=UPI0034CEDA04
MVYYFTSKREEYDTPAMLYMGKHKEENEKLIEHGLTHDVWFHADKFSSAHVYLRLREGESWENIDPGVLEDCAQLTKANSIEGNKRDNVTIIYTPWSNLKKTKGMAAGQVGFKRDKMVKSIHVQTRTNAIVNRLNKTREERFPDLLQEKIDHEKDVGARQRAEKLARTKRELEEQRQYKQKAQQRDHAYDDMFSEENMRRTSNQNRSEDWEDDFM